MSPGTAPREKWVKSWDFIFAIMGSTIGLGNVWRFPYLCFKNGGGAFLLPYFFFAFLIGTPLVILETSIGQKLRKGLAQSWEIVPICKGLAFAQVVLSTYFNMSYAIILAWSLKYFVQSFSPVLPWASCDNPWNTEHCVTHDNQSAFNSSDDVSTNSTSAAEEYWLNEVLGVTSGIEQSGNLNKDLVLYLAIIWIGIYLSTFKGISWTAKVVYVTATLPFLLLAVVIIRGVTLDGAGQGLYFYLVPDMQKLLNFQVWVSAATQVTYSFATCAGILTTLGSYNDYHHNFWRDCIVIGLMNAAVSFASGIGVFSTLGFMAQYQNTTIEQVASSGPGLAFITYPSILALLPLPQLWCAIFFLTLIFLGFDSEFVSQEVVVAFLYDNYPALKRRRKIVHGLACLFMMLCGLSMVTEGGIYVFEILNNYGATGWCAFLIGACEFVSVAWLYGFDRYWQEMMDMSRPRTGRRWLKISWLFVGPVLCACLSVYYISNAAPLTYRDYLYPPWAQVLCHLISLSSVSFIPGFAIYKVIVTWRRGESITKLFRAKTVEEKAPESFAMVTSQ